MRKLLITALLAMCVLAGCGKDETKETAKSNIKENGTSEVGTTEEPKETNDSESRKVIKKEEYKFDDGIVTMSLAKDSKEENYLSILIKTDAEWKAAYAYTLYAKVTNTDEMSKLNPTVLASCGDVMITPLFAYKQNSDSDTEQIDSATWLANALEKAPSDKIDKFSDKLAGFIQDFISK